jgi:hypothetical protein
MIVAPMNYLVPALGVTCHRALSWTRCRRAVRTRTRHHTLNRTRRRSSNRTRRRQVTRRRTHRRRAVTLHKHPRLHIATTQERVGFHAGVTTTTGEATRGAPLIEHHPVARRCNIAHHCGVLTAGLHLLHSMIDPRALVTTPMLIHHVRLGQGANLSIWP